MTVGAFPLFGEETSVWIHELERAGSCLSARPGGPPDAILMSATGIATQRQRVGSNGGLLTAFGPVASMSDTGDWLSWLERPDASGRSQPSGSSAISFSRYARLFIAFI